MITIPKIVENIMPEAELADAQLRVEAWRYSNIARLARYEFAAPMQGGKLPERKTTGHPLIAQDGKWQDVTLPEGCALQVEGARAKLVLADNIDLELELILSLSHASRAVASHMELEVMLGQDATLRILEWANSDGAGDTPALQTLKNNFTLADNATLQHVRITQVPNSDYLLTSTDVTVGADAHYQYFAVTPTGQHVRNHLHVMLAGEAAQASLAGAYQLDGNRVAEHNILIEHQALRTQSRQNFRGVADGESRGIFQGKVHVHQAAQETDAQQLHKALLLGPRAEIDAKPELEIYADNVKCSHGATVGALDENALFYLRSRGIDEAAARGMLTEAFVAAVLEDAPCFEDLLSEALNANR